MIRNRINRTQGFTLIELLVVISIIALLVGLLQPALSRAKESGYAVRCQNNLHQYGLAMYEYVQDNNDSMPHPYRWLFKELPVDISG